MAFSVRETKEDRDLTFIQKLMGDARLSGQAWASSWTPQFVADEFQTARVFVAFNFDPVESVPLGFVMIRPPGAAWEITLTAVDPHLRRERVFSRLIVGVTEALRRDASDVEIHLEVRADNLAAISAYESSGFVAVGRRARYYSDGTDAILYTRD